MFLKLVLPKQISAVFILLVSILVLPLFPFWNYSNMATGFILIILILLCLLNKFFFVFKSIKIVDIGFLLLGLTVLICFLRSYLSEGVFPLGSTFLTFLIMFLLYFCFLFLGSTKKAFKNISKALSFAFFGLAAFVFYTAFQEGNNYASLTSRFSYQNGLGNISQISMYCAFYLIGIFYTQKSNWILVAITLVGYILAMVLHSKLLAIVISLLLIGKILGRSNYRINVFVISILMIAGILCLCFFCPASLNGRLDLFYLSWINYDFNNLFGLGLGKYNVFINAIFINELAVNTIGHVDHLAFNDFTQIFIELGYPGIIGLLLIFIGLFNKQNLFYLGALAAILIFMFPLQYLESSVLFVFTTILLRTACQEEKIKWQMSTARFKPILIAFIGLTICLTYYEMSVFRKWSRVNNFLLLDENVNINLKKYKDLEIHLGSNDKYYQSLGLHLLKNKRYNEALNSLNKAQATNPSYESYIHLGDYYFELGLYNESMDYYKTALLLRPQHLYPVYKSVYSLYNQGETEVAFEYWLAHKANYQKMKSPKMMIMNKEIEDLLKHINPKK